MPEEDGTPEVETPSQSQPPATRPGSTDAWSKMEFHFAENPSIPHTEINEEVGWHPNILYRGRQNWLARFSDIKGEAEAKRALKQEIRALASRWLKMQNLCVLLGAGASYYATKFIGSGLYKLAKALLIGRESEKTLNSISIYASTQRSIEQRFEDFLSQLGTLVRLLNSESWPLSNLRLDLRLTGIRGASNRRKKILELIQDIERAIAVSCNVELPPSPLAPRTSPPPESLTPHEVFLSKLVERDPQCGRGRIFTTNYDTLVEQGMDRLGIYYCDGFSGTWERRFNPSSYDLDLHYPGEVTEGRVRRYDKVLQLFKLHGSINWRRSIISAQDPYGIRFDPRPLPTHEQLTSPDKSARDLFGSVFADEQGLAILPTSSKYGESLAMPYAHLFRAMGQALREAQTALFIIGYSGFDKHINQMIEDALTNPGFTCVVVDPCPSTWARALCLADYCGRVYCLAGQWGTFEFFAEEILPDIDVLKVDLAVAKTLRNLRESRQGGAEITESEVNKDD